MAQLKGAVMDRRYAFAVTIDADKLTKAEAIYLLKAIAAGKAEMSFNGDGVVWVHESEHDTFLQLAKGGKVAIKENMPKRFVKDKNGTIKATDGTYRIATPDDIDKELVKGGEYAGGFEKDGGRRTAGNSKDI